MPELAEKTGLATSVRGLVYSQTSSFVHSTPWSLRGQRRQSPRSSSTHLGLIHTSMIIRATLVVWIEWAAFCDQELGWTLHESFAEVKARNEELQAKLDATA